MGIIYQHLNKILKVSEEKRNVFLKISTVPKGYSCISQFE